MAKNREMLKEAIAEAKAVKEMAIANAKAALEEAFTPQLKSMLSMKLQEMEEEEKEDDMKTEMYSMEKESYTEEEHDGEKMMEVDLEELLAELELEEEEEPLYEAEEDEESDEEGGNAEMEDLSDDEIKDMIEDVLAQMIKDGEIEAGPNFEAEEDEESEESEESEEDEEEVNLEELLREIEEMETKEMENEAMATGLPSEAEVKAAVDKIAAAVKSGEISQEEFDAFIDAGQDEVQDDINKLTEAEGEDIEMMLKNDVADLERQKAVAKVAAIAGVSTASAGFATLIWGIALDAPASATAKAFQVIGMAPQILIGLGGMITGGIAAIKGANKIYQSSRDIASKEYQLKKMNKEIKQELNEAYFTIRSLKSEINEINLLNAKLLYTNKIFKAKNLNENQKVKVLSSFDKAKNVGEVKMVYETLNEGIKVAKTTIKENLGRASKSTVTPTAKQPIVESNDVFKRMQKLAGII